MGESKIVAAAREAAQIAKCDHDWILLPPPKISVRGMTKYSCPHCNCVMWVPKTEMK